MTPTPEDKCLVPARKKIYQVLGHKMRSSSGLVLVPEFRNRSRILTSIHLHNVSPEKALRIVRGMARKLEFNKRRAEIDRRYVQEVLGDEWDPNNPMHNPDPIADPKVTLDDLDILSIKTSYSVMIFDISSMT